MRICFLCTSGLDNASPRGRWLPIARELARRGHETHLTLLHPTYDRVRTRRFRVDGVNVAYVGQMHVYGDPGRRRYFGPLQLVSVVLGGAAALAAHTLKVRPDVLHVAKPQPANGIAALVARGDSRLYVDCDDYEAEANRFGSPWQRRAVRWWEDRLPPLCRGVSVNTRFLQRRIAGQGVAPGRIVYVPNGISAGRRRPAPGRHVHGLRSALGLDGHPTVLYLGTMSTVAHGVGLLLEAFAHVARAMPEARLLMVGDGDDRPTLRRKAEELGVETAVVWTGNVPADSTGAYLALADCSVDPVYDTPAARARSPLKIVESLAAGVPVVTGDVGDRRAMLANGAAGVLVSPGDAHALAEGMEMVLMQPPLRARLALAAAEQASMYDWRRLVEDWNAIYKV